MTRAAAILACALAVAGCVQQGAALREDEPSQLARTVSFELGRIGYDVAPEELSPMQAAQLHFLLDDGPFIGSLHALRQRQRIETILSSPEGAGARF
jgi:hypothetical protein